MVNSSIIETNSSLDSIFIETQTSNTPVQATAGVTAVAEATHLSWKFLDKVSLLDGHYQHHHHHRCEEDNERQIYHYADDTETSDGFVLLSNTSLQRQSEGGYQPLTVMSSAVSAVNVNNQQHQININSNSNTNSNSSSSSNNNSRNKSNNNNNNNSSATGCIGILRNATMITEAGGSRTTNNRQGIGHHSTGVDGGGGNTGGIGGDGNISGSEIDGCNGIPGDSTFHLGLFGWRRKCLYILILALMILIIVNLILSLWILKVMDFSTEGMGHLKIMAGGIQLSGQALIMDLLRASAIRSRHGQPISIDSSRNFSIRTRDSEGILENHLFLGHDKLECLATGFRINDTNGRNLFSVNEKEVTIGAHSLRIDGEGGAIFRESVQTLHVRADAGRELKLESPTRQLEISAAQDITLQARAGNLELTALDDIKFETNDGSLRLESSKIFLPNLKMASPASPSMSQSREHTHRVFQLCACSNGKLFLASPHGVCAGDETSVCR